MPHADWVKEDWLAKCQGWGGAVSQFTPIGLNEIDGRQAVPEDGGVEDGLLFSADWRRLPDSGKNTKVGGAAHHTVQRKQDLFRKGNSSRVGLDST